MRKGPLVAIAVVAFLMATTVLVYLGRDSGSAIADPGSSATGEAGSDASSSPMTSSSPGADSGEADGDPVPRPGSNVPMEKLAPGDTPPQFVLFAIDDAGVHEHWQRFLAAAKPDDARLTAFVAPDALTDTDTADGSETAVLIEDLNRGYARGHDLGVYYDSDYCGSDGQGGGWSTDGWNTELDEFFESVKRGHQADGSADGANGTPSLAFATDDVMGGRISCLRGDLAITAPAWAGHGMSYDASFNGMTDTGLQWPEKTDGVWEFAIPYVYSPAFGRKVIPLNYNLWYTFNGAKYDPGQADQLSAEVLRTYQHMFEQAYQGNRAPVVIVNNANDWAGGAFTAAALGLMTEVCGQQDVYCATFSDVAQWLELQDPAVLAALQKLPAVATGP